MTIPTQLEAILAEREACAQLVEQRYTLMADLAPVAVDAVLQALPDAIRNRPTPASEEVDGWLPIESAPKDKMVLLAAEFDGPGDWRIKVGGWRDDQRWEVFGASWAPTHWRPLPAPPSTLARP